MSPKKPAKKQSPNKSPALSADLMLSADGKSSVSEAQVNLLLAIDQHGSITAAAKEVGISYKTAWDRIDAMNNLSSDALVVRSAGGSRGGGTRLTDAGNALVSGFQALQAEHSEFVARLGSKVKGVDDVASFLRSTRLQTSARNQYQGKVSKITRGGVNSEVEVTLGPSVKLIAVVTNDSRQHMGLKKGSTVVALIKSSWVLLSLDNDVVTSARNQLHGTIAKINKGEVNSEVILDLGDGKTLCAIITNTSVTQMKLKKGLSACALFKASSVILMRH